MSTEESNESGRSDELSNFDITHPLRSESPEYNFLEDIEETKITGKQIIGINVNSEPVEEIEDNLDDEYSREKMEHYDDSIDPYSLITGKQLSEITEKFSSEISTPDQSDLPKQSLRKEVKYSPDLDLDEGGDLEEQEKPGEEDKFEEEKVKELQPFDENPSPSNPHSSEEDFGEGEYSTSGLISPGEYEERMDVKFNDDEREFFLQLWENEMQQNPDMEGLDVEPREQQYYDIPNEGEYYEGEGEYYEPEGEYMIPDEAYEDVQDNYRDEDSPNQNQKM